MHKSCALWVAGCALGVGGCALRVFGYSMRDARSWILDVRCGLLDTRHAVIGLGMIKSFKGCSPIIHRFTNIYLGINSSGTKPG